MDSAWGIIKYRWARWWTYLYLSKGWYGVWSRLYRFVWERDFKDTPLSTYTSFTELALATKTFTWTADSWRQAWDAISYPGKVEWIYNSNPPGKRHIGDCDEFAIYITAVLKKSMATGAFKDPSLLNAYVLTVLWQKEDGNFYGHNVSLLKRSNGKWSYMDYGLPSEPVDQPSQVVQQVLKRYAPRGRLLVYSVQTVNLDVVLTVTGSL